MIAITTCRPRSGEKPPGNRSNGRRRFQERRDLRSDPGDADACQAVRRAVSIASMRTYRLSIGRAAWLLSAACAGLLAARPAEAQRKYLVELGVAPIYTGYDNLTDLGGSVGGLARLGIWLPARFELEGEGSYAKPKTTTASIGVGVTTISGSVLYNIPLGATSFAHARLGIASTSYGTCPAVSVPGSGPCGSTSGVI